MSFKENRDFFFDLFERQVISEPIDNIVHVEQPEIVLLSNIDSNDLMKRKGYYSLKSIPRYLVPSFNVNFKTKRIAQFHQGYSIKINDDYTSVDDYVTAQFKKKAREIRRYVKRLEMCFDINYKMHIGTISKKEYDQLFEALRLMLQERFIQKKEINDRLLEWDRLYKIFFALINENKASIFVVYESGKPISISLNYIFGKFYFNAIASYNLDYSKFGLGNVIIYKQLDWCIHNSFKHYEMGRGDYDYKRRWSNQIYTLDHFLAIPKRSNFKSTQAFRIEGFKIQFFEFLRSKKLNLIYNNIKNKLHFLNTKNVETEYVYNPYNDEKALENMKIINYEQNDYLKLMKPINDFLFSNSAHKSLLKVYKTPNKSEFILAIKNKFQKVNLL
ncbi:GNAT family N-acetyltransferase [Algibacter pectinivorans]|uniref:Acetyltransferase (GNAT) domain-containing protein n=1 Tax=Algibacter pectinivorans TaxID=870482 RepID=A0A1I1PGZ7_9FLAO|nr:GNAT family N-acetyltransferase [Algibacter pectinivorans]SFD06968.1 Acetyltransferase (GNAT) domain-containing protein [Algibacter pectinivorans]